MAIFQRFQSISVSSTVKGSGSLNIPADCVGAEIQADVADIRYTADGATDPTQTSGVQLVYGKAPRWLPIYLLRNLRVIRGSGTDAILSIHYQGEVGAGSGGVDPGGGGGGDPDPDPPALWQWDNGEYVLWDDGAPINMETS